MKPTPTKPFSIRFTAHDVAQAGPYISNDKCLVATALRRRGYIAGVGSDNCYIDGKWFAFSECAGVKFTCSTGNDHPPFYRPEVIGRKLTLSPF